MKPRVILLQPAASGLEKGKGSPSLPLALVYAASRLPESVDVELHDLRLTPWDAVAQRIGQGGDIVCFGLTAITGIQAKAAAELARRLHAAGWGPVVWGGKHATLFGRELVGDGLADLAVVGDGEQTFADIVAALLDDRRPDDIPGVWLARDGRPHLTGRPEPFALQRLARLRFDLLRHDYRYRKGQKRVGVLETSRGCPGRCTYCYLSTRDKPFWHGAPPAWVTGALGDLRRAQPPLDHIDFVDDNFFADRARALAIARRIAVDHPGLTWTSNGGRLRDLAAFSDAELTELAAGGLDRVDIGVETASPRLAEILGKTEPPGAVVAQVQRLRRVGIVPWINLMVGLPDETELERGQTIDLALELTRRGALISPMYAYTPYPGTALATTLTAAGHALPTAAELGDSAWNVARTPWVGPRLARRLATLYAASLFIDDKLTVYRPGWTSRLALAVLRPLSRWRLRRRRLGWPVERWLLRRWLGEQF